MANHAEKKWQWQGRPYTCRPGQLITSLVGIQQKCGKKISIQKIRTALQRFENMGFLNKQSNKQNTLITICNWSVYQGCDSPDNNGDNIQLTHISQTDNKRITLNKNEKNEKNEKKVKPASSFSLSFEEQDIRRAAEANANALAAFMSNTYNTDK